MIAIVPIFNFEKNRELLLCSYFISIIDCFTVLFEFSSSENFPKFSWKSSMRMTSISKSSHNVIKRLCESLARLRK